MGNKIPSSWEDWKEHPALLLAVAAAIVVVALFFLTTLDTSTTRFLTGRTGEPCANLTAAECERKFFPQSQTNQVHDINAPIDRAIAQAQRRRDNHRSEPSRSAAGIGGQSPRAGSGSPGDSHGNRRPAQSPGSNPPVSSPPPSPSSSGGGNGGNGPPPAPHPLAQTPAVTVPATPATPPIIVPSVTVPCPRDPTGITHC